MRNIEKILKTGFAVGAITMALWAGNIIKNKPVAYTGAVTTAVCCAGMIRLGRSQDRNYNSNNRDYNSRNNNQNYN